MKNYISILILFSLSIVLIFLLVSPQYQKFNDLKKEISAKEFESASQERYFEGLRENSEELKKYESFLLKLDSALPENPSLPEFSNLIQKLSSEAGVSLNGLGSYSTELYDKLGIKKTTADLVVSCGYSEFKNFLSILETSARIIEVEKISFSGEKTEPFNYNLILAFYSYSKPQFDISN